MNFIKHIIFIASLFIVLQLSAQQSQIYTYNLKDYQNALTLYNNKQYQASQSTFREVKQKTNNFKIIADCDYYIANSAIRLNQRGADKLMEDFVEQHSTSTKRNSAMLDVGDYYFSQRKYGNAVKWYNKTEGRNVGYANKEKFNFRKGYSLFATKKYEASKSYFEKILNSKEYGSQAKYYIGYMAYRGNDYDKANRYFEKISDNKNVNKKLSYYQADMNFKLGKFSDALKLAIEQLPKSDRNEKSELNKIIGESYFNLKKYNKAVPYLKEYKGKQGKWNNTDFYQLGYAYYKEGDFAGAVGQFNKIIDANNPVAQNAYYHLAECYLKTNKKQEALNAFKNASEMNFNSEIQKDAWLNYAKLSYDIGNAYENVSQILINYLKKYPESPSKQEIQDLLVNSYITTKNYEAAISLLENNKSFSNKIAYQQVTFYRGLELFNERKYKEAKVYFNKSLNEQQDDLYVARATFWKAEIDYLLNDYEVAVIGFKEFIQNSSSSQTAEYENIDYNLGYVYFKQKEYNQAEQFFSKFIKFHKKDLNRLNDSYLRLGDSHFVTSSYWPAIEAYNEAIKLGGSGEDYAYFQKAISYGLINRSEKKIEELNVFIKRYTVSVYRDDALYELGNTYVNNENTSKGIETYKKLVSEYSTSSYVPKAMLREGLVYYNSNKNEAALTVFRRVVEKFSNTQEAIQAVSTSKLIYIDEGRVNEYANWVQTLDFVEVTDAELDNATFEGPERQYAQGNTKEAIKGLENYVSNFPNGIHSLQAHFYLAQSYFGNNQISESIPSYEVVISKERNEFTEQALVRLSEIYLRKDDFNKVMPYLKRLEQEADFPQNITFAQSNLMKANYELNNYAETINYAEKVLSHEKIDNRIKSDANIMIARSAIKTNNEAKAKSAYVEVQKTATGVLAAEALYYEAYFKNKEEEHEASNIVIQSLAKNYSGHKEFGGKGLLLMAKNFYALDDAFQATYILESVINNFSDYPEVVNDAKSELIKIKVEEAKRNSSVNPESN